MVKTNINVEVDEELAKELKIMALQKGLNFHDYVRDILQVHTGKKKVTKGCNNEIENNI